MSKSIYKITAKTATGFTFQIHTMALSGLEARQLFAKSVFVQEHGCDLVDIKQVKASHDEELASMLEHYLKMLNLGCAYELTYDGATVTIENFHEYTRLLTRS